MPSKAMKTAEICSRQRSFVKKLSLLGRKPGAAGQRIASFHGTRSTAFFKGNEPKKSIPCVYVTCTKYPVPRIAADDRVTCLAHAPKRAIPGEFVNPCEETRSVHAPLAMLCSLAEPQPSVTALWYFVLLLLLIHVHTHA